MKDCCCNPIGIAKDISLGLVSLEEYLDGRVTKEELESAKRRMNSELLSDKDAIDKSRNRMEVRPGVYYSIEDPYVWQLKQEAMRQ